MNLYSALSQEFNPDLMTLFRMFNVISLKAIKDPCVMHAAFLHGATLQVFDGFSWVLKPEPHCLFSKALTL
jgi:hypothetical protein